jgi:AcrR family transcriptional regulator
MAESANGSAPSSAQGSGTAQEMPATKQAVYDAALRLFAQKGFAATGMRELSHEAGVNLATVNYFFGSKKGLLKAILDDFFTGVLETLHENIGGDEPPKVKMRRVIAAVARYYGTSRDKMLIALTELPHDDPDITEFKAQWFSRLNGLFPDALGPGSARLPDGIIGPAMVALAASHFLFLPIVEKVVPPETLAEVDKIYPDLIGELFVNGLSGLLAKAEAGRG